jgi:hypothetical protein
MYRMERRDLGLYLYDSNNRPVTDAQGRLIVLSNRWGVSDKLTLTETDNLYINTVNARDCAHIDTTVIPHNRTLSAADPGQVLDPAVVYEARLTPLLLHEDFGSFPVNTSANGPSGTLDGWQIMDQGTFAGPSRWEVQQAGAPSAPYIVQTSAIWGGTGLGPDPVKPGTMFVRGGNPSLPVNHPDQPANWSDYRLSVYVRAAGSGAIGVVFRYQDGDHYYRFSMDAHRRYRRLVRVDSGVHTILAEDDFVYRPNQDYLLTVQAVGNSMRIFQDGAPVFSAIDGAMAAGSIGLYCWDDPAARFTDLRVDDFRTVAPVVYRFKFTTSKFTDFFHQLHSYQDETWLLTASETADLSLLAQAVALTASAPSAGEARAYDSLGQTLLSQNVHQDSQEVQVSRVEQNGRAVALLLRSPEPIDWTRAGMTMQFVGVAVPKPLPPAEMKLTAASFAPVQPNDESVSVLLRQKLDPSGTRIENCVIPGPVSVPPGDPVLFRDDFSDANEGILFQEDFGPNALNHYVVVDEGTQSTPSAWAVSGGNTLVQTSSIYGGNTLLTAPEKPGTLAVTGAPSWTDVRIAVTAKTSTVGDLGVVFRYIDEDNYYRLSLGNWQWYFPPFLHRGYRRLIKRVKGKVTVLWQDSGPSIASAVNRIEIYAYGDRSTGYVNDELLFSLSDADLHAGKAGLYCWRNPGAQFTAFEIGALAAPAVLWQPGFADVSQLQIVDESGASDGPSQWAIAGGVLAQTSTIGTFDPDISKPGTCALCPAYLAMLDDFEVSVRLRSDVSGGIGVVFRYVNEDNYYRFSMDRQEFVYPHLFPPYRRLVKKVNGTFTLLWQDNVAYTSNREYELTLRAVGDEISGLLDGFSLFAVQDGDLRFGRVGLYCSRNAGANFLRVVVADRARRVGSWTIHDEPSAAPDSIWKIAEGALRQLASTAGGFAPNNPGTIAVAGEPAWTDYRAIIRLRTDVPGAVGVLFRHVDEENYYRLSIGKTPNYRRLIKKIDGVVTTLWQDSGSYIAGEPFTVTIDAVGAHLTGYLGDTPLFSLFDGDQPAGRVGVYSWGNSGMRCEYAEVRRPPIEAYALLRDRFDTGDMSAFTVVDEGVQNAPSNWAIAGGTLRQTSGIFSPNTAANPLANIGTEAIAGDTAWADIALQVRAQSGASGAFGVVFRYLDANHYYRFSMERMLVFTPHPHVLAHRRLVKNVAGTFTLLWEDTTPYNFDREYPITIVAEARTLRGYIDGIPVFAVRDNEVPAGRVGLYCYKNDDARFRHVRVFPPAVFSGAPLLHERFLGLVYGRWNFVDDSKQSGPSHWAAAGQELQQTSGIFGGSTAASVPDKPGTYALLTTGQSWTDYRVTVVLTTTESDGAIGVMFRYQDNDNYYRFSMDASRSYRRLIKKVAGKVTALWQDANSPVVGHPYLVTLDCVGDQIAGYLDGLALFTVNDGDFQGGSIALYSWHNKGARFEEVRVSAPAWMDYYSFGQEETFAAGTKLRVYSGNAAAAPPVQPGILQRFVATLDDPGDLQFGATSADLRVMSSPANAGHFRRFLPASAYAVSDFKVLRKADGTGMLIVPPVAGGVLEPGEYRLTLTYRRDNSAADPKSQVLSEADDTSVETVVIDVPWRVATEATKAGQDQ